MDTAHPLLQPVGVPGNVVVEQDVAELQVDAFAGGFRSHQRLYVAVAELLFNIQSGSRLIPAARVHTAVDLPYPEPPGVELFHQVIQSVLKLGENQQPLFRVVKEALLLQDFPQPAEFRLSAGVGYGLRLDGEVFEFLNFRVDFVGTVGHSERIQLIFQTDTFFLGHFLEIFRVRDVV